MNILKRDFLNFFLENYIVLNMSLKILLVVIVLQSALSEDIINDNMYKSKDFLHDRNSALARLISEQKFSNEVVRNAGKDVDVVNSYEDITILDDDGQLKSLKFKSARLKLPELSNLISVSDLDNLSDNDSDSGHSDKDVSVQQSKFFDELGCKYLF